MKDIVVYPCKPRIYRQYGNWAVMCEEHKIKTYRTMWDDAFVWAVEHQEIVQKTYSLTSRMSL